MTFLIKICGVTTPDDAALAAKEGADMIGVNFWRNSQRYVTEARAREVLSGVPTGVLKVGVFVNAHPLVVTETIRELALNRVQLHGDEKVGDWGSVPTKLLIRALRVNDEASLREGLAWDAGTFICDAHSPDYGGSGLVAPWKLIAEHARRPFLLAGGLTPENVAEGIAATRPNGVDVSSGVESSPGVKDPGKLRAFIQNARAAAKELGLE